MTFRIEWSEEARAAVRRLDKPTAMRVFEVLLRFARTGEGDIKQLPGALADKCRLRIGDYRLLFSLSGETLRVHGVKHRSEAYR